jgi:hypothetical protein
MTAQRLVNAIAVATALLAVAPARAGEALDGAFGQVLGQRFDPAAAIAMGMGRDEMWFEFKPEATLPVLNRFRVLVTPIGYRIHGILGTAAASPAEVPQPLRADPQGDVGPALRKLQGVRADGLCAQVRDARLVVETSGTTDAKSLSVPMPVTGDPAWLGDSDWIVVTGLLD